MRQNATLMTSETSDGILHPRVRHQSPAGIDRTADTVVAADRRSPAPRVS